MTGDGESLRSKPSIDITEHLETHTHIRDNIPEGR